MGWAAFWVAFVVVVIAAYLGVGAKRATRTRPFTAFLVAVALLGAATPFVLPKSEAEQHAPSVAATGPNGTLGVIVVPSDERATYTVLALSRRPDGIVEISTQRKGSSGVSFTEAAIDCEARLSGYVREAESLSAFKAAVRQTPAMGPLVRGSISDVRARWACKHAPT